MEILERDGERQKHKKEQEEVAEDLLYAC